MLWIKPKPEYFVPTFETLLKTSLILYLMLLCTLKLNFLNVKASAPLTAIACAQATVLGKF